MPAREGDTLSPAQVAVQVGVDEKTVRNWIHAGVVEATRTPAGHYRLAPTVVPALQRLAREMPLNARTLRGRLPRSSPQERVPTRPARPRKGGRSSPV
jgi:excisionase family DNA binding protein